MKFNVTLFCTPDSYVV